MILWKLKDEIPESDRAGVIAEAKARLEALAGKIPGLDCVSIGPDLNQIHTVRESMNIPSVQRVYAFVLEVLKRMK